MNQRSVDALLRAAAVLCVLIAAVLWGGPAILRADLFDDDAAQHVYWLYQYADPALFPNDLSVHYLRTSAPLGYRALFATLAPWVDVLAASEWLSLLLLALSGWLAWQLATAVQGPGRNLRGLAAVVAILVLISVDRTEGGILWQMAFQRSFALPNLLLCAWALQSRRYLWVGIAVLMSALFYPVTLPVLLLASGFIFLLELLRERRMPPYWLANLVLACAAVAAAFLGMPKADDLLPDYTYAQAMSMPEYGVNGRLQLYVSGLLSNLLRYHMTGMGWAPWPLICMGLAVALAWLAGQRRLITPVAWVVVASGLGLWLLMRLFPEQLMFGLYLPNRHARWVIPVFGVMAFAAATQGLVALLARGNAADRTRARLGLAGAACAPLVVLLSLWPHAAEQWRTPVDRPLEATYAYLATLPKDTLIGAHPDLASYIPLRSQRSVLTSSEVSMPWKAGYYRQVKPQVEALLRAAYATDMADVDREVGPLGVKVFVTCPDVWKSTGYFEPFDPMVQHLLARGREAGFVLQHPPADRVLFRSGDCMVLGVKHP